MQNSSKNDEFPLQKSKFSTSKHLCQTYAKMTFESSVIQCTKSNMVKHGECALFLPSKFEKMKKNCKIVHVRGFEPHSTGWKPGIQTTRPQSLLHKEDDLKFAKKS